MIRLVNKLVNYFHFSNYDFIEQIKFIQPINDATHVLDDDEFFKFLKSFKDYYDFQF